MRQPAPAVFIDRDGTLMEEVHYCRDAALVRLFEGVPDALHALKNAGFKTVLVTNQSGIAKGIISPEDYETVHARLMELLGPDTLDAVYMSPEADGVPSTRRKPAPGMLFEAVRDLALDLSRSWMIGDKDIDVECGVNAGIPGILVRTGHGHAAHGRSARHIAATFAEATTWLLSHVSHAQTEPLRA